MSEYAPRAGADRETLNRIVDWTLLRTGNRLVIGAPLGLGKPNDLINAFYLRACADPDIDIEFVTALSLDPPTAGNDLQARFLEPLVERLYGADYPRLAYVRDLASGKTPANFRVTEFYFQSGSQLGRPMTQRRYISSNYTHVARDLMDRGINVLVQMVAAEEVDGRSLLSLSCNPDITLNLAHRLSFNPDYRLLKIAQINQELPFLHGDAIVERDFFDCVVEPPCRQRLFAVPRAPVSDQDYWVGLHASTLIADAGTLQIGIGTLSDALVHALCLRHRDNVAYRQVLEGAAIDPQLTQRLGGVDPFQAGLFGASEMFMDGFMHLHRAGILRRAVHDDEVLQRLSDEGLLPEQPNAELIELLWEGGRLPCRIDAAALAELQQLGVLSRELRIEEDWLISRDGSRVPNNMLDPRHRQHLAQVGLADRLGPGALLEAAFFLGSGEFYDWLRELPAAERPRFRMTSVHRINQLYGGRESLEIAQRRRARFVNTCMMMSLTGAAVSDALADHQVVSGVGGQYNFVAMAHALHEGRSILMLRSARQSSEGLRSNIVWEYPHTTIPRHLRDLVVTEYGAVDLRGRTDEECIAAMISIADVRFQRELAQTAMDAGKLARDYEIPARARDNTPEQRKKMLAAQRANFTPYPFGSDFTPVEERLVPALTRLKSISRSRTAMAKAALAGKPDAFPEELARMGLQHAPSLKEKFYARLIAWALAEEQAD